MGSVLIGSSATYVYSVDLMCIFREAKFQLRFIILKKEDTYSTDSVNKVNENVICRQHNQINDPKEARKPNRALFTLYSHIIKAVQANVICNNYF